MRTFCFGNLYLGFTLFKLFYLDKKYLKEINMQICEVDKEKK